MKPLIALCLFVSIAFSAGQGLAKTDAAPKRHMMHPDAPPETALLSQLFGEWDAYSVNMNQDGTWSSDTTYSQWHWYAILDGNAIQDDWIKIENVEGSEPVAKVVGTNIRIYDPKADRWDMAWIDSNNRKLSTFTAENGDGTVTMFGHNAQGRETRNVFHDISANEFHWEQQWTFDNGANWIGVARIHCIRKQ